MAITQSAKKEIRASSRKRVFNLRRLRAMRSHIKMTTKLAKSGDAASAKEQYRKAQKAIDKAAKRGVIKPQTAARRKASLVRVVKNA